MPCIVYAHRTQYPQKMHCKKKITMRLSWCFWTRKIRNRDSGFMQFSRELSSRESFMNWSRGWSFITYFRMSVEQFELALLLRSERTSHIWRGREIISESRLTSSTWLCVWGKIVFYYFRYYCILSTFQGIAHLLPSAAVWLVRSIYSDPKKLNLVWKKSCKFLRVQKNIFNAQNISMDSTCPGL